MDYITDNMNYNMKYKMNYKVLGYELRENAAAIIMAGGGGHIGGDMSVMDILVTLYFRQMNISPENISDPSRDYFILSKGHCVEALYAVLAAKGFFPLDEVVSQYSRFGSRYIGHPNNKVPGIEMNSGSLGHGLPVGVGIALGNRKKGLQNRTYVVMGDGELAEGSVWEGAMAAYMCKQDNLCAVVDRNRLQISGSTEDIMAHGDLKARFSSFGWHVIDVPDGNDSDMLNDAFNEARQVKGCPSMIIANTVKGYGSPVMENKASWHHHLPTQEEYDAIITDLEAGKEAACIDDAGKDDAGKDAGHIEGAYTKEAAGNE